MAGEYRLKGRALVLSDIHQNVDWVEEIMRREEGGFDFYVCLGDFFDSRKDSGSEDDPCVLPKAMAQHLKEMIAGKYGKGYFTPGNHDLQYMESWWSVSKFHHAPHYMRNSCGGFTKNKAKKINKILSWEDWRALKPFYMVNGWLCSHAGFLPSFFQPIVTLEENLQRLWGEIDLALEIINCSPSHYFDCGFSRRGNSHNPGPFWADFSEEFEDIPGIPQIVGHTAKRNVIRQVGGSYCIDGYSQCYALIEPDGKIEFKSLTKFNGEWMTQIPELVILPENRGKISKNWKY